LKSIKKIHFWKVFHQFRYTKVISKIQIVGYAENKNVKIAD